MHQLQNRNKKKKAFKTGSFDPCVSYHHPIRNVCNVSMVFVCGICIQCIPYEVQFSLLSLPEMRKQTNMY